MLQLRRIFYIQCHEAVTNNQTRICKIETNIRRSIRNHRCKKKFTASLSMPKELDTSNCHGGYTSINNRNRCALNDDVESDKYDLMAIDGKVTHNFHADKQCDKMEKKRDDTSIMDKVMSSSNCVHKLSSNPFKNNKSFSLNNDLASLTTCQTVSSSRINSSECNDLEMRAMEIFTEKTAEEAEIMKEKSKHIERSNLWKNKFNSDDAFEIDETFGNRCENNNNCLRHCIRCNKPLHSNIKNNSLEKIPTTNNVESELEINQNIKNECHAEDSVVNTLNLECINQDRSSKIPVALNDTNTLTQHVHPCIKSLSQFFEHNCDDNSDRLHKKKYLDNRQRQKADFHVPTLNEPQIFSDHRSNNFFCDNKYEVIEDKILDNENEYKTDFRREIIRIRRNLKSLDIIGKKKGNIMSYSNVEKNSSAIIEATADHLPHDTLNNSTAIMYNEWNSCDENQNNNDDEQWKRVVFPKETQRAMAITSRSPRKNKEYQRNYKKKDK